MHYISKDIILEMAHRLPDYNGQCANIHGHSWKLEVCIGFESLIKLGPNRGMAMDFADLKTHIVEAVFNTFDHSLVLWRQDPIFDLLETHTTNLKIVPVMEPPTSEFLSKLWLENVHDSLKEYLYDADYKRIKMMSVMVKETCTSSATYMVEL